MHFGGFDQMRMRAVEMEMRLGRGMRSARQRAHDEGLKYQISLARGPGLLSRMIRAVLRRPRS